MNLSKKYKEKFGHLEGVKSLGWGSVYSQQKRFDILLDIGVDINDSVLDVGCGYGDFSKDFVNYLGIDLREDAITMAKNKYSDVKFELKSIYDINDTYDWVFASGIFCFINNWEETEGIIEKMFNTSKKGTAFNFLSALTTKEKLSDMKPTKIEEILPIIYKLTNKFTIRHDYLINDFTIYLYKQKNNE